MLQLYNVSFPNNAVAGSVVCFGLHHKYNFFLTKEVRGHFLPEAQEGHLVQRHQGVLAHPENKEKNNYSIWLTLQKKKKKKLQ